MLRKVQNFVVLLLLCGMLLLSGCVKGTVANENQPVTIKIAMPATGWFTDQEFDQYITQPVQQQHPNITIEKMQMVNNSNSFSSLMDQGPDIIIASNLTMSGLKDAGFTFNMEPLIKSSHLDLSRFESVAIDAAKIASGGEYMACIPYTRHFNALYYNKDIFDKFGVEYPKDGMTWDDLIALAGKLTRMDGDVQYRGLAPDATWRAGTQLGAGFVDPVSNQSVISSDKWKEAFQMMQGIYTIPGNSISNNQDDFMKNKTLAMFPNNNILSILGPVSDQLNWDMVSYPTFNVAPNTGYEYDAHVMILTANSPHKEAAMQVISTVVSDDVQMQMAENGRISVLTDPKLKEAFGKNLEYLKGKNVASIFKTTPAKPFPPTKYDEQCKPIINNVLNSIIKKGMDLNSAVAAADDSINQLVAKDRQSQ